jgi:hypothetical protein
MFSSDCEKFGGLLAGWSKTLKINDVKLPILNFCSPQVSVDRTAQALQALCLYAMTPNKGDSALC